jgi:hypothetical protein
LDFSYLTVDRELSFFKEIPGYPYGIPKRT